MRSPRGRRAPDRGAWLDVVNRNFVRRLHHHAMTAVEQGLFLVDKQGVIRHRAVVGPIDTIPERARAGDAGASPLRGRTAGDMSLAERLPRTERAPDRAGRLADSHPLLPDPRRPGARRPSPATISRCACGTPDEAGYLVHPLTGAETEPFAARLFALGEGLPGTRYAPLAACSSSTTCRTEPGTAPDLEVTLDAARAPSGAHRPGPAGRSRCWARWSSPPRRPQSSMRPTTSRSASLVAAGLGARSRPRAPTSRWPTSAARWRRCSAAPRMRWSW